jgi:hypothetical protein
MTNSYYEPKLVYEYTCCVCGKKFDIPEYMREGYTYRISEKWCCSYGCYSKKIDSLQPRKKYHKKYRDLRSNNNEQKN